MVKKKTKEMFTFHRVGWINQVEEEVSGWLCLIETKEQLDTYLQYLAHDTAQVWCDIKDSPENKEGHCRTTRANAFKTILTIEMEKRGLKQMPMVQAVTFLEQAATKTVINIFYDEGSVYANSAGGCRTTHLRNDHRGVDEKIFEIHKRKDFVFPTDKSPFEDVKITRWPGSPHFYLSVNGKNIEVDGVQKWNTVTAAEEAMESYLNRNKW